MSDSDSDYNVEEYIKPETVRRTYNNEDGLSEKDESDEESGIDQDSGEEDVQDIPNGQCIVANGIRQQQRAEPNEPQKSNSRFILYVTNLAATTNRTMLEDFFGDAGAIKSIRIPKVRLGNFAFVEMFDFEGYKVSMSTPIFRNLTNYPNNPNILGWSQIQQ